MTAPTGMGQFEFVRLSALRAAQLIRGCTPRVEVYGKLTTMAQREVKQGMVSGLPREPRNGASSEPA